MINNKRLIALARRWKKFTVASHRRISEGRSKGSQSCKSQVAVVADKGHFVVYTVDKRRFMIPLPYLTTNIFRELLRMSEEEFGLPGDGPITLPCDAAFMDYIISSMQLRCTSKDLEDSLLMSMSYTGLCPLPSSLLIQGQKSQQIVIHAF